MGELGKRRRRVKNEHTNYGTRTSRCVHKKRKLGESLRSRTKINTPKVHNREERENVRRKHALGEGQVMNP